MDQTITTVSSGGKVETLTTDIEFFGPPGKYFELRVRGLIDGDPTTVEDALKDLAPRRYKVSSIFGRSHIFHDSELPYISIENGNSFLLGNKDVEGITLGIANLEYNFHKNQSGEYSYVELLCSASNFKEAQAIFFNNLSPYLDLLSYSAHCSLFIQATRVEDIKYRLMIFPSVAPYRKSEIALGDFVLYPEMREIYAMYREAMNSSSNIYKFLCFYKIMEGLYTKVRPDIFNKAKSLNLTFDRTGKRIPDDPHLVDAHKKYVGMTIRSFFESVLTTKFRHGAAHFILKDGGKLNVSSLADIENYTYILYITEICIRILIDETIVMLSEIYNFKKSII